MADLREDNCRLDSNVDEGTPLLTNTKAETKRTPLPKFQIAILLFAQLCEPVSSQLIYPFIAQLISELDITGGDRRKVGYYAGVIESLFFATEALTVLHWSRLSDYYGRKPILLIGLSGLGLSVTCFGLSRTFWGLVVSRCLSGMLNGNIGVMKSAMAEITDSTNRAEGFALMPAIWGGGATLGPLIGGTLARPHDRWPNTFSHEFWIQYPYFLPCAAGATLVVVAFTSTVFFFKETLPKRKTSLLQKPSMTGSDLVTSPRSRGDPVPLRELLVFPVLISVANYCYLALLDIAVGALRPLFLALPIEIGGLGLEPSTIGLWLGGYGFSTGTFQIIFFGRIVRRWGTKRVFIAGILAFFPIFGLFPTISYIAQTWGTSPVVWALLALQIMCSIIMDMSFGCVFMYITAAAPNKRSLGATHGLSQTTVAIARAIGPAMATSLFAYSVQHNILGGFGVYALLLLLSCFALVIAAQLPHELWKNEEDVE